MFRDMREDKLSAAQMRTIIMERIAGDVMNQVIRMDVDNVEGWLHPSAPGQVDDAALDGLPPVPLGYQEELANSLGYSPMQGAVGKNGVGKWGSGKGFGKDQKGVGGKGFGKDQKGGGKDEAKALARASALSARALTAGGAAIITEPAPSGSGQKRPRKRKKTTPLQ